MDEKAGISPGAGDVTDVNSKQCFELSVRSSSARRPSEPSGHLCKQPFGEHGCRSFSLLSFTGRRLRAHRAEPSSLPVRVASPLGSLSAVVVFYVCDIRVWTGLDPWKKGRGSLLGRRRGRVLCLHMVTSRAWSQEACQVQVTWESEQGPAHLGSPAGPAPLAASHTPPGSF